MKILRKISNRRRFAVIPALVAGALLLVAARAPVDDEQVGAVTGINGPAFAMQDAAARVLKKGTGKGARLEIRMIDDAVFTLGERSLFVVQEYFLNQDKGNAAIRLMTGAIKVVTGKIAQLNTRPFELRTEVATIGVRGTTFWGGELDGVHQFALLEGRAITIENRAGRIEITKVGDGAKVDGAAIAPSPPRTWSREKLNRAAAMTTVR